MNPMTVHITGEAMSPLLILAIILMAGMAGEHIARRLRAPGITGNLAAGILLGPSCLGIFGEEDPVRIFGSMSSFAMVFIALAVGSHLSYRRIHNALGRIVFIVIGEVVVCCAAVIASTWLYSGNLHVAVLLGTMAIATAPTTTLAIVRENRARGPFVKTLMAVVALDCALCILLFSLAQGWAAEHYTGLGFTGGNPLLHLGWQIFGAFFLAVAVAGAMEFVIHRWRLTEFISMFLAVLLIAGFAQYLHINPLLTGLFVGVFLANYSHEESRYVTAFEPIEVLLFTGFFTLAGVGVHWESLGQAGVLCIIYFLARGAGKAAGAFAGGIMARCPTRIRTNMPISLFPQAGVVVGLVIILENDPRLPADIKQAISVLILAAVAINEIVGPFFTRSALRNANEVNRDRPRLMSFLQEEYILSRLVAKDKWEAIQKLANFFIRTHPIPLQEQKSLVNTIIERERSMTTAIGCGIAIPHGRVNSGNSIQGVLALCPTGVDFSALDDEPVKVMILIVTPKEHELRHQEVLASLAGMLSNPAIRDRLIASRNAHDAWEVIEDEENRNFNYFLEDAPDETNTKGKPSPGRQV
ncbi:MAG TPA: PTS sugar transporter subunit IIA [Candidatus Hydrogenedentes bacterium]|nr:PTS sugar transporter subunit IIA [Candidatus Hydrogenedentota bacterium]